MKEKAIVTIAVGSSAYFKASFNLACSYKYHGGKHKFILLCDKSAGFNSLTLEAQSLFDEVIEFEPGIDSVPFYSKTLIRKYIKEDEFLYFDADSIFISNPDYLFEELKGSHFQTLIHNKGIQSSPQWAVPSELIDHYGFKHKPEFWELNSSLIYSDNSKVAQDIFKLAEHFYSSEYYPKFVGLGLNKQVGHFPDELAFEVATMAINYTFTQPDTAPMYIRYQSRRQAADYFHVLQKAGQYCIVSLPGWAGHSMVKLWNQYEKYHQAYSVKLGERLYNDRSYFGVYMFRREHKAANSLNLRFKGRYAGLKTFTKRPAWVSKVISSYLQPKAKKKPKIESDSENG